MLPGVVTLVAAVLVIALYRPAPADALPADGRAWSVLVAAILYPLVVAAAAWLVVIGVAAIRRLVLWQAARRRARPARPGGGGLLERALGRWRSWPIALVLLYQGFSWLVLMGGHAALTWVFEWPALAASVIAGPEPPDALVRVLALPPFLVAALADAVIKRRLLVPSGATLPPRREAIGGRLRQLTVPLAPVAVLYGAHQIANGVDPIRDAFMLHPSLAFVGVVVAMPLLVTLAPIALLFVFPRERLPEGDRRRRFEALAARAGTGCRDFVVWRVGRSAMPTAAMVGLFGWLRFVFVTDALIGLLSPAQLDGVVAHELAHARRGHMAIYLSVAALFVALLGLLVATSITPDAAVASLAGLADAAPVPTEPPPPAANATASSGDGGATIGVAISTADLLPLAFLGGLAAVYWLGFFGWISRRVEIDADRDGARLVGTPEPLCEALERIVGNVGVRRNRRSWRHPSVATRVEAMRRFFVEPAAERRFTRQLSLVRWGVAAAFAVAFGALVAAFAGEVARPPEDKHLVAALSLRETDPDLAERHIERSLAMRESAAAHLFAADAARRAGELPRLVAELAAAERLLVEPDAPIDRRNVQWLRDLCARTRLAPED